MTQVTGNHRDVPVAFSPDSTELLFVRLTSDSLGSLMRLTVASGGVEQITADGVLVYADDYFGSPASWSPDGSQIAYAATDETGSPAAMSAYVAAADGSSRQILAGPTAYLTSANWAPDGS